MILLSTIVLSRLNIFDTLTVISGRLPARQITRSGLFLLQGEKMFNRLPALAYYPHPKTKENHATVLSGKELTNLER